MGFTTNKLGNISAKNYCREMEWEEEQQEIDYQVIEGKEHKQTSNHLQSSFPTKSVVRYILFMFVFTVYVLFIKDNLLQTFIILLGVGEGAVQGGGGVV